MEGKKVPVALYLSKFLLVRRLDAVQRDPLAGEAVGVREGSLDPAYVGHGRGTPALPFLFLDRPGVHAAWQNIVDSQGWQIQLLLFVWTIQTFFAINTTCILFSFCAHTKFSIKFQCRSIF